MKDLGLKPLKFYLLKKYYSHGGLSSNNVVSCKNPKYLCVNFEIQCLLTTVNIFNMQ